MIIGSLALALLGAACGKSAAAHEGGGSTSGGGTTKSGGSESTSTVSEGPNNSFTFSPSTVTVEQGQILTLKNVGNTPHTFTVAGKIDTETQPGQTSTVTIDLPPGRYPFVCRFHKALGMTGTLVVG